MSFPAGFEVGVMVTTEGGTEAIIVEALSPTVYGDSELKGDSFLILMHGTVFGFVVTGVLHERDHQYWTVLDEG